MNVSLPARTLSEHNPEELETGAGIQKAPCECSECQNGWIPVHRQQLQGWGYTGSLTNDEAKAALAEVMDRITTARANLVSIVESHGDALMTSWKKKGQKQRAQLIKEFMPDLEEEKWFIFRDLVNRRRENGLVSLTKSPRTRCNALTRWLSVEILKESPRAFLSLLHARTFREPEEWAPWDLEQLSMPRYRAYFAEAFNEHSVAMCGPKYGKLVRFKPEQAHRMSTVGFPGAFLVLEAQSNILSLLSGVASKLKSNLGPDATAGCLKWKIAAAHTFTPADDIDQWTPYSHQGFFGPPELDFQKIIELADTRQKAASDHLFHAQTDFGYIRRTIKTFREGRVNRAIGESWSALGTAGYFVKDVQSYHIWRWLKLQFQDLKELRDKYGHFDRDAELPTDLNVGLRAIVTILQQAVLFETLSLAEIHVACKGFETCFDVRVEHLKDGLPPKPWFDAEPEGTAASFEDRLNWCLYQMSVDSDVTSASHYQLPSLFALLKVVLSKSCAEQARISPYLMQRLENLSAVHEIYMSVQHYRPKFGGLSQSDIVEDFISDIIPKILGRSGGEALQWAYGFDKTIAQAK